MKKIIFIILLNIFTTILFSQEKTPHSIAKDTIIAKGIQSAPEFPGGVSAFYEYIIDNFKPESKLKGVQKLYVCFVVEKDGTISNVKILKGMDEKNDKNLIKIVQNSPKWSPGMQSGKPVRASFNLPLTVNFK
jgi:protein TonB